MQLSATYPDTASIEAALSTLDTVAFTTNQLSGQTRDFIYIPSMNLIYGERTSGLWQVYLLGTGFVFQAPTLP